MAVERDIPMHWLHMMLDYDTASGLLTWKARPVETFANQRAASIWNKRFAGSPAFTTLDAKGYLTGKFMGRRLKAHRVLWAMTFSEWPDEIDHINGDKSDNRLANLRSVTHRENCLNFKRNSMNKTGRMGVYRRPSGNWYATISDGKKRRVIGTFPTMELAVAARSNAEIEHNYHANHGRN